MFLRLLKAIDNLADQSLLQGDLESIIDWSLRNNMTLHPDKFQLITHEPYLNNHTVNMFSHLPFANEYDEIVYTAIGTSFSPSKLVTDLGITITPDFNFSAHISKISIKAGLKVSWI